MVVTSGTTLVSPGRLATEEMAAQAHSSSHPRVASEEAAARLYRLAIEKTATPGTRYHRVAEEGIAFKDIAEAIGKQLNIPVVSIPPEKAADHFGWFVFFAQIDGPASGKLTRERLGWQPVQPSLLADLEKGSYFKI